MTDFEKLLIAESYIRELKHLLDLAEQDIKHKNEIIAKLKNTITEERKLTPDERKARRVDERVVALIEKNTALKKSLKAMANERNFWVSVKNNK